MIFWFMEYFGANFCIKIMEDWASLLRALESRWERNTANIADVFLSPMPSGAHALCTHIHVYMYTHIYTCIYIYIFIYIYIYVNIYIYIFMYVCINVYVHI